MATTLAAGDRAPAFTLNDQDGTAHRLSTYRGQSVVLFFYPRDMTSGCAKEACSFRDQYAALKRAGTVVLGVSTDDAAKHQRFRKKYGLPFPLLVDADAKIATKYNAWGEKVMYGKRRIGMIRSTFLIGPEGKLLRVWPRVKADGHGEEVLTAIKELGKELRARA